MLNQDRRQSDDAALDERLTSLLEAAAAPTEPGPLPGEAEALAAFRASHSPARRSSMLSSLTSAKAALVAALSAGVLLTGGVGAATAGVLPGAAQDHASNLLSKVGVTVPGADERSAGHAEERGASEDAGSDRELPDASDKGQKVAETARSTELTGVDKGAAVSELASGGKSHAGEHGGDDSSETADDADHGQDGSTKAHEADTADDVDEAAEVKAEAPEDARDDSRGDEERADVEDADQAHDADEKAAEKSEDSAEKAGDLDDHHSTAGTTTRP